MKFVHPKDNIAFKPAEKALLKAYWRQGINELRNAMYQDTRIAAETDYGIWGRATPGEVSQERAEESPKNLLQAEQEKLREQYQGSEKDKQREMTK